ncbi:DUF2785 domain-containing protein [Pelomonas sp. V22]|uniref:DUF2785 domain-containing protein n=1 Tax=Pelomonas sp. V22 TaxID=2822139 RepID=UPI0024A8FF2B|nr:DUF2785 domain-containing protein [Pelomonas sp. V22]MDI4634905.1 DUF2785 domain-containing protein [Pelomonas sp. V22]
MHRLLILLACPLLAAAAQAACPAASASQLREALKPEANEAERAVLQTHALNLASCLANPDPALRDGLGFELLSTWMRAKALKPETLQVLRARLLPVLSGPDITSGFHAPFAALTLAEIARVDRLQPFLSPAERLDLLERACAYLAGVRDYRGFTQDEGWRHGVAHGADLLMQLSLNPALDAAAQRRILQAVASQVLAAGGQAYQFGEGQRLARPALFAAARGEISAEDWQHWLTSALAAATPNANPDAALLARIHNAREFLWPLYVSLSESRDETLKARLLPALRAALQKLG